MPLKTQFQIVETTTEITSAITKFGGQPVWISHPYWPLCPETGEKMLFMSQISLDPKLFPDSDGTMVYVFFCDECESLYKEAMATVIQTSDNISRNGASYTEFVSEANGPAIYELDDNCQAVYKEYKVLLDPIEDEEIISIEERYKINNWDDRIGFQFSRPSIAGNKIGGQPLCLYFVKDPEENFNQEEWLLLLQLAPIQGYWNNGQPNFYPFYMYLNDSGILTVFISSDYKKTKCYVQQG
ncbi:MAG: DUF1963 domain-containing protein [Prochloraceae cyanobacterium]